MYIGIYILISTMYALNKVVGYVWLKLAHYFCLVSCLSILSLLAAMLTVSSPISYDMWLGPSWRRQPAGWTPPAGKTQAEKKHEERVRRQATLVNLRCKWEEFTGKEAEMWDDWFDCTFVSVIFEPSDDFLLGQKDKPRNYAFIDGGRKVPRPSRGVMPEATVQYAVNDTVFVLRSDQTCSDAIVFEVNADFITVLIVCGICKNMPACMLKQAMKPRKVEASALQQGQKCFVRGLNIPLGLPDMNATVVTLLAYIVAKDKWVVQEPHGSQASVPSGTFSRWPEQRCYRKCSCRGFLDMRPTRMLIFQGTRKVMSWDISVQL